MTGRNWTFHLSTALIAVIAASSAFLTYLRRESWQPECGIITESDLDRCLPGWLDRSVRERALSPDGSRFFDLYAPELESNRIYDSEKSFCRRNRIFDFGLYDHVLNTRSSIRSLRHYAWGFIDDDQCVMRLEDSGNSTGRYRVWHRRFPEWWWGHFYRPEVWLLIIFGSLWGWQVIRWFRRRKTYPSDQPSPPPPTPRG
jgi:hypothetical protein